MTYKELKKRLIKVETALKDLNTNTDLKHSTTFVKETTVKLTTLKESILNKLSLLKEEDGTVRTDDERKAEKLTKQGVNVDLVDKIEENEENNVNFSVDDMRSMITQVGRSLTKCLKTLGDEVARIKAHRLEENSFDIHVTYKGEQGEDEFAFHIQNGNLHLADFSFNKKLVDIGVKPSGEAFINQDVLKNELIKHFKSVASVNETKNILKEFTDHSFKGSEVIDDANERGPDMFGKGVFADLLPKGVASENAAVEALKAHDKSPIKARMGRYAPMFVHVQYHNLEHEGEKYQMHQTQYYNSNFKDKDPNFNPGVSKITLFKDPDGEDTNLGTIIVKTDEYVQDLRNLPGLGKRVSENLNELDADNSKALVKKAVADINGAMFKFRHSNPLKMIAAKDKDLKVKLDSMHNAIFDLEKVLKAKDLFEATRKDLGIGSSVSKRRAKAELKKPGNDGSKVYGLDKDGKRVHIKSINDVDKFKKFELDADIAEGSMLKEFVGKELEDRNEPLYDALVAGQGKSETVEGEMLRAINRIAYRFYNDGDKYFQGYGTETAGPAHSFLVNANHPLKSAMIKVLDEPSGDSSYERMLKDALDMILDYIESRQGKYTPNNVGDIFDYEPEFEDDEDDYDDDPWGYNDEEEEDYYNEVKGKKLKESTDLYQDSYFTFTRYAGGKVNGPSLQITVPKLNGSGFDYIQIPGREVKRFAQGAVKSAMEFKDINYQGIDDNKNNTSK